MGWMPSLQPRVLIMPGQLAPTSRVFDCDFKIEMTCGQVYQRGLWVLEAWCRYLHLIVYRDACDVKLAVSESLKSQRSVTDLLQQPRRAESRPLSTR